VQLPNGKKHRTRQEKRKNVQKNKMHMSWRVVGITGNQGGALGKWYLAIEACTYSLRGEEGARDYNHLQLPHRPAISSGQPADENVELGWLLLLHVVPAAYE
jgi:hypothetical protein